MFIDLRNLLFTITTLKNDLFHRGNIACRIGTQHQTSHGSIRVLSHDTVRNK